MGVGVNMDEIDSEEMFIVQIDIKRRTRRPIREGRNAIGNGMSTTTRTGANRE